MAIIDVIKRLENEEFDEEKLGEILRHLKEDGMSIDYYFVASQKLWQVVINGGNDLQYFGSGKDLATALTNGLLDWYYDYDTQ